MEFPGRIRLAIETAQRYLPRLEGADILDIACGHNFPVISWFQDINAGPLLAGYLASQGANVTGLDELHFRTHKDFRDHPFTRKWGSAQNIAKYFSPASFDLVISTAYFGYISSRQGTRPSARQEFSILEQAYALTRPGGVGIHVLVDGYWQLEECDLRKIGYEILEYSLRKGDGLVVVKT